MCQVPAWCCGDCDEHNRQVHLFSGAKHSSIPRVLSLFTFLLWLHACPEQILGIFLSPNCASDLPLLSYSSPCFLIVLTEKENSLQEVVCLQAGPPLRSCGDRLSPGLSPEPLSVALSEASPLSLASAAGFFLLFACGPEDEAPPLLL